ncbi:NAD-dependent malic enzyme [Pendulispora albinea]|uniref:NAD-dependent malic enzyme n=1 Tax=Pendulispora albinea TaxID=2741071 RepID=A0ABZ2M607_9BACT
MTIPLRGAPLLRDPRFNKGTAFTLEERESLGLLGLLPEGVDTLENQVRRAFTQLAEKNSNLGKYIYLSSLQDNNETLFYKVLRSAPAELLPLVYTPTVGEACERYGHIMRRARGLYVPITRKGHVRELLRNWPVTDVRFIVVTNGNRILGLGDLGANGMAIPIGKLALYTACGGVPPELALPVLIDCGTDNAKLLNDPLYLGLRRPRPSAEELDEFVEEFVEAVKEVFPRCCIQFEDWAGIDAMRLLERYRDRACCFNDDIQGTAAVALAGLMGATRITGTPLAQQRVLFLGAGSAGLGIAGLLTQAMVLDGLSLDQARSQIAFFDVHGLIESTRTDLHAFQKPYAHAHAPTTDFVEAIEAIRPTAIVGVSTVARAFDRRVIEAMAKVNARPIIFPYSNPTSRSECTAEEAYQWSQGRAVFASGSPFPPVRYEDKTFVPGQGNNVYIFPAIGMAVYATQATRVTDEMFIAAARGVAEQVTQAELDVGLIYPPQSVLLQTELFAATRVAEIIYDRGLTRMPRPDDLEGLIRAHAYVPEYRSIP